MRMQLYYWPGLQGRGEFVRLALEDAGADYEDMALQPVKEGGGVPGVLRFTDGEDIAMPPFAPPFLKVGRRLIGQTANILLYLGPRLGLVPRDAAGRCWAHQLQLTIADLVAEVHDAHHPLSVNLYYHQQKAAARRRTRDLLDERLPKYLGYFERVIERNPAGSGTLVGADVSQVDLSMAQIVAGLRYAFPQRSVPLLEAHPRLQALHDRAFARPRLAQYLASDRRVPFNVDGIFRHYAELDV